MKLAVTGALGHIGSKLIHALKPGEFDEVRLIDNMATQRYPSLFNLPTGVPFNFIEADIMKADLDKLFSGIDAVIHLAALSNDPIGNLNEAWTREINGEATIRLARLAKQAGVQRFIFSSSCIMYGLSQAAVVDESAPLAPQTEYARSKVDAERALSQLADERFSPTFCRNGTVYGLSPRMRFDTVLNDLMGSAFTTGRVVIHSDGTPWRPVVHVEDVARAFQTVLEAPREVIHNEAFNTGSDNLNHQIRDLGQIAAATVSGCELEIVARASADQRTYKADFGKFRRTFPHFEFLWTAQKGAHELYAAFRMRTVSQPRKPPPSRTPTKEKL